MRWALGLIIALTLLATGLYFWAGWSKKPLDMAAQAKASGQFALLGAGQVHYRWDGPETGPIIVMSHGFSTPNFIYEQNAQALAAAGFRVLRYDHFGRGWSDRPRLKYDVDFYDQALLDLLRSLQIDEPVGLVGLSMGGPITAEFAARYPEKVSRLVLFVPAGLDTAGSNGLRARVVKSPVLGDWIWRVFGKGVLLGDPQYDESHLAPENRLAGDVTVQMEYRGYLEALLSTLRHFPMTGREETYQRLADSGVPVMAIYGRDDPTVLVSSAAKLQAMIPDADVRILDEAGHGLNYQRHSEVNPWLVAWFSE
ncbi:MAG: alpha/beta hydrolase [Pseudomonadota bacterium]